MPILTKLNDDEARAFIHLVKNQKRTQQSNKLHRRFTAIDQACDNELKKKLAKISEDENFSMKNAYHHETTTMIHADKKKMPVDVRKVRDALRSQHLYRARITNDVNTYDLQEIDTQYEEGIIASFLPLAFGEYKDLLTDLEIDPTNFQHVHYSEVLDNNGPEFEDSMNGFMNSRFTTIDMTDYEADFPGYNEITHEIVPDYDVLSRLEWDYSPASFSEYDEPAKNDVALPMPSIKKLLQKEHEFDIYLDEGQEMESLEEPIEYDDEEEEEDEPDEGQLIYPSGPRAPVYSLENDFVTRHADSQPIDWDLKDPEPITAYKGNPENRAFFEYDNTFKLFNRNEIDAFMRLLQIKPTRQWYDDTVHHYKLGGKTYEDDSQQTDPYFHLLAEVERKHLERRQTMNFRSGAEVKLMIDPKKRPVFDPTSR